MKHDRYPCIFSETRFTDSVNTTNSTMLILELRNVIRFGQRDEYLILSFVYKFASMYMYMQYKVNESIIEQELCVNDITIFCASEMCRIYSSLYAKK